MPFRPFRATPFVWAAALAAVATSAAGCNSSDPLERARVGLRPPAGWTPVGRTTWPVPGDPLAAWKGPGGASLVVYSSLPVPGGKADAVVEGMVNRLENMPGLRVIRRGEEKVGGAVAARLDVSAPGNGQSFAPTGIGKPVSLDGKELVPTRRVVVTLVRPGDTLSLVWHAPETEADALEGQVRDTLKSLTVGQIRLATQSY